MLKRRERSSRTDASGVRSRVLVVDDEADIRELLEITLIRMGLDVDSARNVQEARRLLEANAYDLCLTDMRLPDGNGLDLVAYIGAQGGDLPVAVITAYGTAENAVAALKAGAFDYLAKPVSLEQLRTLVKSAVRMPKPEAQEASRLRLLGESPAIQHVREMIEKLARSQAPIYISGESGSGKELAARLIHIRGSRAGERFVPVNCGAIPENLMESEFFGYRKGAFTGAEADRDGFFHAASGGTLFLDEVADLPLGMQVKLLRAIQERKVRKVGATQEEPVDVRIISATHQNLANCVESGKFRQDLYYRLNVIELKMPALREMREDIPLIASALLERLAESVGTAVRALDDGALRALQRYDFPGNVRELENILERAMALADSELVAEADLQLEPRAEEMPAAAASGGNLSLPDYLDRLEKDAILDALQKTRYNRTAAAKLLGITFRSLRYRLDRLGIE